MSAAEPRNIHTRSEWFDDIARAAAKHSHDLQPTGPSGTSPGMEERVAKLETHFEYVRRDLDEIKLSLGTISSNLGSIQASVGEAKAEAALARAHAAGKGTVITTGIGSVLAIIGVILALLAFGGDRFSSGMDASAIAKQAATEALAAK